MLHNQLNLSLSKLLSKYRKFKSREISNKMKILLSSVFKPFGVDDQYGRKENPSELFHNQVTREQGIFSPRWHSQSYGLYFIAENIHTPTTVLDFPSEKRFIKEIQKEYDYIGISFILSNFNKAKRMADLVRKHAPRSRIILGGHGTMIQGIEKIIEHDYICRGEGVTWLRRLLGEDENLDHSFKHPILHASLTKRYLGIPTKTNSTVIMPGVGCPNACRFCCTSHFFGKKYINFFSTGQEIFDICVDIEKHLGYQEFTIMDENFLKYADRAKELLCLMEKNNKPYHFDLFSSADTVAELGVEFLVRLGVRFIWIGVESKFDMYDKNKGIDFKYMIRNLREHGIAVLASSILFVEKHDKETIWEDIRYIVGLESDFVQFMPLGILPGTTIYQDYNQRDLIIKDIPFEEWHGQTSIYFKHSHFTPEESKRILKQAFQYDYNIQGSSILRTCDTIMRGYRKLACYNDSWIAKRKEFLKKRAMALRPALEVMRRYAHNDRVRKITEDIIARYDMELGPMSMRQKLKSKVALFYAAREASRIAKGNSTYQPKTKITNFNYPAKAQTYF